MYYKVIADKEQLQSVGIDRDLTDNTVEFLKEYGSGYYQIDAGPNPIFEKLKDMGVTPISETYDIPKKWLKKVEYVMCTTCLWTGTDLELNDDNCPGCNSEFIQTIEEE